MGYKIDTIEGIGPAMKEKLAAANINTTDDLLKLCCDKSGRVATAEKTECSEAQLLKWVNMADLMRVKGVGEEYSELLEAAGVDTVKELRNRRADNLTKAMADYNATRKLVRSLPSEKQVTKWIDHAKTLEPLITH